MKHVHGAGSRREVREVDWDTRHIQVNIAPSLESEVNVRAHLPQSCNQQ